MATELWCKRCGGVRWKVPARLKWGWRRVKECVCRPSPEDQGNGDE